MSSKMWLGTTEPADFKVGGNQVQRIMVGSTQVWPEELALNSFGMNPTGVILQDVCQQISNITHYHDGPGAYPKLGNTVYTDAAGQSPIDGGDLYFRIQVAGAGYVRINSSGVVTEENMCGTAIGLSNGNATSFGACQLGIGGDRYHDGPLAIPGIGDTIYTDSNLTTTLTGGNQWYQTEQATTIQVDDNGLVIASGVCG